ncbi:hypothetical protein psyc5s11_30600 [Clostridium gelidum]|uniref:Uncharacterized protein n=1 Tax=Clostridium gelidum TaxID=704125 RepID=A0ABN6IZR3_9CLOT|nr:hypothetical protein psyc5s11_30600 [Clostridium gelidum]
MIYIASAFAQLERETIAERVRDNMDRACKELSMVGRFSFTWLFKKKRILF